MVTLDLGLKMVYKIGQREREKKVCIAIADGVEGIKKKKKTWRETNQRIGGKDLKC